MTIAITADWHLQLRPRDAYRFEFLEVTLPQLLHRHQASELIICGDLTDEKDRHAAPLVNRIVRALYTISQEYPVTIICGNHDYLDRDAPFFAFLSDLENIAWIDRPYRADAFLFLPHTRNYERDWQGIVNIGGAPVIFTHNTFSGARGVNGHELAGIPVAALGAAKLVISGDVHVPQKLGPVTYVGAPYTINFGDNYQPRMLFLAPPNKVKSVDIPGRQKRLLEITASALRNGDLKAQQANYSAGDLLKIRVDLKPQDIARWAELKQDIASWASSRGVTIDAIVPVTERARLSQRRDPTRIKSDYELLHEYAGRLGLDPDTLQAGINLLKRT